MLFISICQISLARSERGWYVVRVLIYRWYLFVRECIAAGLANVIIAAAYQHKSIAAVVT